MATTSIMQEIRSLLSQGKSASEVIALGYKPPTVYKVQRQVRKQQQDPKPPGQMMEQQPPTADPVGQYESSSEDEDFFEFLFGSVEEPAQSHSPDAELDQARARIAELEQEAGQVRWLQQRVRELESGADATTELRQRVRDLEAELEHANHTLDALSQSNVEWQIGFNAERAARLEAERKYDNALVIVP